MTKKLLRRRGTLLGLAIYLTLVPLSFRFDNAGIAWTFLGTMPPQALVLVLLSALACWAGFFPVTRRLRATGL